ncbi:la-related protein 4B isoform X1 [Suricata suricatta]|uniref:la-related protein 4B isoform X1 n=1 Tax=Suricata suricatta TaxID=37032 RepID=UPI001155BD85|nr:la-related protein 4B isoform X1 [Suricata suricatta]
MEEAFKGSTDPGRERPTMSLRAHTGPRLPNDYTESSTSRAVGTLAKSSSDTDAGSLGHVCAVPEECEDWSQELVSPARGSCAGLLAGSGGSVAVAAHGGRDVSSEKERENHSLRLLSVNDCLSSDASRPDHSLVVRLGRVDLSSERCVTSLSFGNERLPVHASFQEVAPNRPGDPGPEHPPGPAMVERQRWGGCSLKRGNMELAAKELSLQTEGSSSSRDKDKMSTFADEGRGQRAFERRSSHPVDLHAGPGPGKAPAQVCDLTGAPRDMDTGQVFQVGAPAVRISQEAPLGGKALDGSRCHQSNFISSAFVFACTEEESDSGRNFKTEGEIGVKNAESDQQRLAGAGRGSLKANLQGTSENDGGNVKSGNVKSGWKATFNWGTSAAARRAVPSRDTRARGRSDGTERPGPGTSLAEESDEACRVKDHSHEDLDLAPPPNQSSSSGEQGSQVEEMDSAHSGENAGPGLERVFSELAEEGASGTSRPALAGKGGVTGSIGGHGMGTRAHHLQQRDAKPMLDGPVFSGGVAFVRSPQVTFGEVELGETLEGYLCVAGVDPAPVDRSADPLHRAPQVVPAVPGGGAEMAAPRHGDYVLSLTEDAVTVPDRPGGGELRAFPEGLYSQFASRLACYPVGGFASQILSGGLAGGCTGCQEGCPGAPAVGKDAFEEEQMSEVCLHRKPPDLEVASFWMEKPPYQLPVPEDAAIWGWQNRGGHLVPTAKVSELNPNAKVWGTPVLQLEAGSAADGSVSAAWEEPAGPRPACGQEGLDANGDGDKGQESVALSDLQEPERPAVSAAALDRSEYESPPENSETETIYSEPCMCRIYLDTSVNVTGESPCFT